MINSIILVAKYSFKSQASLPHHEAHHNFPKALSKSFSISIPNDLKDFYIVIFIPFLNTLSSFSIDSRTTMSS